MICLNLSLSLSLSLSRVGAYGYIGVRKPPIVSRHPNSQMNHFLSLSLYFLLEYLPKVDALTKRECVLCEMIRYFNDRQQSIHGVGTTDTLPSHATKKKQNQSRYRILSIVDGSSSIEIINPCQGRWWWRGCNRRAYIYTGTGTGTTLGL